MEMLKKMYLRELYQNRVTDRQQEAQEEVSKGIGLKPVISSSAGGGGSGAGGGGGTAGEEGATPEAGGEPAPEGEAGAEAEAPPETGGAEEGF